MQRLKIFLFVASFFSVFFSASIVLKLEGIIPLPLLILAGVFIIFILSANEYFKITHLKNKFNQQKHSFFLIIFTFSVSVVASAIGIYFFINQSDKIDAENNSEFIQAKLTIKKMYTEKIDSVKSLPLHNLQYAELTKSIEYWKTRVCRTNEERDQARANVIIVEKERVDLEEQLKNDRDKTIHNLEELAKAELVQAQNDFKIGQQMSITNQFIFAFFFALVLFNEVMLVGFVHQISNYFTIEQRRNMQTLRNLLYSDLQIITLDDVRYDSAFNPSRNKDLTIKENAFSLRCLFGNIGIIEREEKNNGTIKVEDRRKGVKKLQEYYERIKE